MPVTVEATRAQKRRPGFKVLRVITVTIAIAASVIGGLAVLMWHRPATAALFSTVFGDRGARVERDVAFGAQPRQKLDVYRPPIGTPERDPIILFLYGGSWSSGSKDIYAFAGQALAARGFTTVVSDYRLYPEVQFPAFVEDAAAAYVWTERTLAKQCTPQRPIIIAGHSAGGHMAALLGYDRRYIQAVSPDAAPPAAIIGLAGPYTFEPTVWPSTREAFASVAATPDRPRPVTFVAPGAPPSLLLHGAADDLVALKNTRELELALKSVGTPTETAFFEGVGHIGLVLTLAPPFRWRAPTLDRMAEFASTFALTPPHVAACAGPKPRQ